MRSTRRGSGKKGRRRQAAGRAQVKAGSHGTVPPGPPSQAEFGITGSHGAADSGTVLVQLLISWDLPQTGEITLQVQRRAKRLVEHQKARCPTGSPLSYLLTRVTGI